MQNMDFTQQECELHYSFITPLPVLCLSVWPGKGKLVFEKLMMSHECWGCYSTLQSLCGR